VWELRKKYGYQKVEIPHLTKKDLYEKSGHWQKFGDELFRVATREGHFFALKPMNCPHHTQIYKRRPWSYKELPQAYANTTMVYRDEQTGELAGLSRVRSITQDDAHVFCRTSQIEEQMGNVWNIIEAFYGAFGIALKVRLSFHDPKEPEKFLGTPKLWKIAEGALKNLVKQKQVEATIALGEAAFYGPKIDFLGKDSLGREHQVATIQLDMVQPERFDLTCINEDGKQERIVMIHAAIMGSLERFMALIIEHFAGAFPVWLAPEQVRILPVGEKFESYANEVLNTLKDAGIRAHLGSANETLGKRIREAEMQKIPYVLILGEREEKANAVSVRHYQRGQEGELALGAFTEKFAKEIKERAL
jgi:threonyl-tRNA synthetase